VFHKDFLGKELSVGDDVVFMQIGYRNFLTGTIHKLNKVKATISHGDKKTIQFYSQIIKITKNRRVA
jgi:hypothetical protein